MDRFFKNQRIGKAQRAAGDPDQSEIPQGDQGRWETTSPSSFQAQDAPQIGLEHSMFPDLTRDDVFRIETARLWLRWPRANDVPAFARLASDQDVAKMTTCLPKPFGAYEAEDFVIGARRANAEGRGIVLALAPRNDPAAFIGMVGVQTRCDVASGEADLVLGYWLGKPYWGQGLMQEAIEAVLDMAFVLTDAQTIEAPVRDRNVAARKVLARCGFPEPAADASHVVITRDAWLMARAGVAGRIALPLSASA